MFDYYQQWFVSPYLLYSPLCILPVCITGTVSYQALFVLPFLSPCITLSTSITTFDPHNVQGGANLAPDLPADQNAPGMFTYSWRKAKILKLTKGTSIILGHQDLVQISKQAGSNLVHIFLIIKAT